MDKCIDGFRDATVFSTVNSSFGYWQMKIDERGLDETASTSYHSLYRLTRMPFGLQNPQVIFHRAMDTILACLLWQLLSTIWTTLSYFLNRRRTKSNWLDTYCRYATKEKSR